MSSPSSINISSGEVNRPGNGVEGPPRDRNPSKMDTIEDMRNNLQKLEEKNLELTNQHLQNMSRYENEIMKLKLELKRKAALLRILESEMSFARREAQVQMYSADEELRDAKAKLLELQTRGRGETLAEPDRPAEAVHQGTNTGSDNLWLTFVPKGSSSPCGPAPAASWGQPRDRCYPLSGNEIPSGGTLYITCPTSGTGTASESTPSYFIPRGTCTPGCPAAGASWRDPRDQHFSSGSESDLDGNYSQHFVPLRAADHTAPDLMHYASDTDLPCYWRPRPPPLPSFVFPRCESNGSYSSPGSSGPYVSLYPSVFGSEYDSSYIRPLSTFTYSIPSSWCGSGTGTGSSFNPSASFGSHRACSLPSFSSF